MVIFHRFFNKILASFQSSNKFSQNISFENSFCIPYLGKDSHHFANRLSALIRNKYNLKISPIYKTFKVVNYFQLKSKTPRLFAQMLSINSRVCAIRTRHTSVCPPDISSLESGSI